MSDASRDPDEPLTQLDVNVDTSHLDSIVEGSEVATTPRMDLAPVEGADGEPLTMEPPKKMGVPRLRANTMMGVAPPSSGAKAPPTSAGKGPPTTEPATNPARTKASEGEDEQTTLVGKLLADAHAEVRARLKERAASKTEKEKEEKEGDLYQDETATTVGDAEKLIAAARVAALIEKGLAADDDGEDKTASGTGNDTQMEDTTAKRDAINVEAALARAAELRAEAEARKRRQLKKQTMHGLGNGPLKLPARPTDDELATTQSAIDTARGEAPAHSGVDDLLNLSSPISPADGEMETLSAGIPAPAPMRMINTEPETVPVQLPAPVPGPYTQPMPYAPTVRMDGSGASPALDANAFPGATPNPMPSAPHAMPSAMPHGTPPGGMAHAHFHSTPMPVMAPHLGMPHSGPEAFARTHVSTRSQPLELPKKSRTGLVLFVLVLIGVGGAVGYWKRAPLRAMWQRYRHPVAQPAPAPTPALSTTASTAPPASLAPATSASASASAPASASAAPNASASAAPHASGSAAPHASASASASTRPGAKKPPPWRPKPKPKGPVPKPSDEHGF